MTGSHFSKTRKKNGVLKMSPFSGSKIPLLAIHKIISHIWQDRSRKVNNDEPNLRFFTETFDLLSARPFENLVFRPQSQGGKFLDFQTPPAPPPAPPPDELSNPDSGPFQRTQGRNTSARAILDVDIAPSESCSKGCSNWYVQTRQQVCRKNICRIYQTFEVVDVW